MRILMVMVLVGAACDAGEFQWSASSWSVTTTNSGEFPPYTSLSYASSGTSTDTISGNVHADASNPPGAGGPSVTGRLSFSRSFQISGSPNEIVSVTWRLTLNGSTFSSPIGGSNGGRVGYRINTASPLQFGSDDYYQALSGANVNFTSTYTRNYPLDSSGFGTFTASGYIEANAFALSGPNGNSDMNVSFGVVPVHEPVGYIAGLLFLCTLQRWRGLG